MSETLNHNPTPKETVDENQKDSEYVFLLGGKDQEMSMIHKWANLAGVEVVDKAQRWEDAEIQTYQEDVERIIEEGKIPIAIELRGAEEIEGVVDIDHHNEKSDRPSSLQQVQELLGIEPRLADQLTAANDSAYIPGMLAIKESQLKEKREAGASPEELEKAEAQIDIMIEGIRRRDRKMQGVTLEMEQEAEQAIENAEFGPNGLVIVRMNSDRASPVTDRLFRTWEDGKQNLVVVCSSEKTEKEVWYFGDGKFCSDIIEEFSPLHDETDTQYPDGQKKNEYFTVSGGAGLGQEGENALAMVVASDADEILEYITRAQEKKETADSPEDESTA